MTKLYVNPALDWLLVSGVDDFLLLDETDRTPPDYPSTPAPMTATITSIAPTYVSVTNSLKRQVRSRGAQAWQMDLYYGAMTRATFAPLWAFLINQSGQFKSFTVALSAFTPLGSPSGTPLVNGALQSGVTINTDGWTPSQTVLKKGDWIQFENDAKVYSVISDAISNGSGQANLRIFPALRKSPADNFTVYTDPLFTVAMVTDQLPVDFDQCLKARGFSITFQEVL